jgi:hypothetical protein
MFWVVVLVEVVVGWNGMEEWDELRFAALASKGQEVENVAVGHLAVRTDCFYVALHLGECFWWCGCHDRRGGQRSIMWVSRLLMTDYGIAADEGARATVGG